MISPAPSASRIERYAAEVAAAHDVEPDDVMGSARTVAIVQARWALWKRLFDDGFSTSSIARSVGRHHTTVMHALRK
jgi:chromosomal replication initiation ATPase DnaA